MNRSALGIILVIIGSVFLLNQFDLFPDFRHYIFSWPNILFLIAIALLLSGKPKGALVLVMVGAFFWLQRHFYVDMRMVWPVALIGIGLYLLLKKGGHLDNSPKLDNADSIDESVFLGGSEKSFTSKQLKGGRITAVFGGSELNLRESLPAENCVIDAFVMFGGAELKIPADWNVNMKATPVLGGVSDERDKSIAKTGPTVTITGTVVFGGISIK